MHAKQAHLVKSCRPTAGTNTVRCYLSRNKVTHTRVIESALPKHTGGARFAAITANEAFSDSVHRDSNNEGPSLIRAYQVLEGDKYLGQAFRVSGESGKAFEKHAVSSMVC